MRYPAPFFPLMGRAAVFWVGTATFATVGFLLLALSQPDETISPYVDSSFLAAFAIPAVAGWLAGAIIQEFQGCTFAWALPAATRRIAGGYLMTGAALSLLVGWMVGYSSATPLGALALSVIGLAGYCYGGSLFGLRSWWSGALSFLILVALVARSKTLTELTTRHPWWTLLAAAILVAYGSARLFQRTAVRQRYFLLANPFPGSHSLERSVEYQRRRMVREGPRPSDWRRGYLGSDARQWVRAALHESYGSLGWRIVPRLLQRFWALVAMFAIFAWADKGDLGFGESLARTAYGALLGSPHVPVFSAPSDRHPIVILVIAGAGAALALWSPADLKSSMAYPLSRHSLALTTYRLGLIETTTFFVLVGIGSLLLGHLGGWYVGYELRFDFMPFFLYPLLATAILTPAAFWARHRLRLASHRRRENTLVAVVVGVLGLVGAIWILTVLLTHLFSAPGVGWGITVLLLVATNLSYRRWLRRHFATADLV